MRSATAILILAPAVLGGCARLHSTTWDASTGQRTSYATVTTFFDSTSALTKFQNRASLTQSNEWAAGTSIGQLNQTATSTNLNDLIGTVVGAAVQGAIKGAK